MDCPAEPVYPPEAMWAYVTGRTRLKVLIQPDGSISEVRITQASGRTRQHEMLDRAALVAMQSCRYRIPKSFDARLPAWQAVEYNWQIDLSATPPVGDAATSPP